MPNRLAKPILACAIAVSLLGAAPAAAFPRSQAVGGGSEQITGYHLLAVNPGGRAIVVWVSSEGHLRYALAAPGRPFGAAHTLGMHVSEDSTAAIAINAAGEAVVSWAYSDYRYPPPAEARFAFTCCEHVNVAFISPGGRLLSARTVSSRTLTAHNPRVAISATGAAAVVYGAAPARRGVEDTNFTDRVQVSGADGRFGSAASLHGSELALRVSGSSAIVAYERAQGTALMEATFRRSGRQSTRGSLGAVPSGPYSAVEGAYDAHGDLALLASWQPAELVFASLHGGQLASAPFELAPRVANESFQFPLASSPSGRVLIARTAFRDDRIGIAEGTMTGSAPRQRALLSPLPAGMMATSGQAALASTGAAALTFLAIREDRARRVSSSVYLITRPVHGGWARPVQLTGWGRGTNDGEPRVALDAHGDGRIVWEGTSNTLRALRFHVG